VELPIFFPRIKNYIRRTYNNVFQDRCHQWRKYLWNGCTNFYCLRCIQE